MKSYPNIEHHKNFDGSRTGYDGTGRSWRISGHTGYWCARANVTAQGLCNNLIGYETLDEISQELKQIHVHP